MRILRACLLVSSWTLAQATTCNQNNCLRAVEGSAFPTRPGTADCSSYFQTTVTPATSTVFETVTASVTPTLISSVTATTPVPIAVTTVVSTVETDYISITATVTDEETSTSTGSQTVTVTGQDSLILKKRQATVAPCKIPAYASACSGPAQYSSACSCIGVTAHTTTAPQPTTTSTVTTTVTPFISTIYTTVFTVPSTSTFTTVTVITTYSTEDVTTIAATNTLTTTDATATVTATLTQTVVPPAPTETFYLRASYMASDIANPNIFGYTVAITDAAFYIDFTPNLVNAVQFGLERSTGYVTALNGSAAEDMASYSLNVGSASFVLVATYSYALGQGGQPLTCSIDASNNLTCLFGTQTAAFWLCGHHLTVVTPDDDYTNGCGYGTAEQITLSVIPVV